MSWPPTENDKGQTAIEFYMNRPHLTDPVNGGHQYMFRTQAGTICMAWVNAVDLPYVLALRGGCCGQKKPGVYRLASPVNALRWEKNNASLTL